MVRYSWMCPRYWDTCILSLHEDGASRARAPVSWFAGAGHVLVLPRAIVRTWRAIVRCSVSAQRRCPPRVRAQSPSHPAAPAYAEAAGALSSAGRRRSPGRATSAR